MCKSLQFLCAFFCAACATMDSVSALPNQKLVLTGHTSYVDIVGDVDGTHPRVMKAVEDTLWIADWSFDSGGSCTDAGWTRIDNRVLNDGNVHWDGDDGRFHGIGGISGEAAVLGQHDLCWELHDGYDNEWYQAIRIEYTGASFLSFDYLLDAQDERSMVFDYLQVEVDSACASLERGDYNTDPRGSADFRMIEFSASGLDTGFVDSLELSDFAEPEMIHCVYIAFTSGVWRSPQDGLMPTDHGIALAVDNIALLGGTTLSEDFEVSGSMHLALSFVNIADAQPFGEWARVFQYVTDNDACTENRTCAWLWTDHTTPTIANDPSMTFGPDAFVVRNWLDNIIVSPWVSLAETQDAAATILSFREFGGNAFPTSRIVRNWSVRGKLKVENTDSVTQGDSIDCVSAWQHHNFWNSLSFFRWITRLYDMSPFIPTQATEVQVSFRVSDWQIIGGASSPSTHKPGPGPYIDRVRIGRRVLSGPVFDEGIDSRYQAQDGFPTEIHPFVTPAGEHHRPLTSELIDGGGGRFGTAAFSRGQDLNANTPESPNLVTGDSITIRVVDLRDAGGISSVEWYGSIVAGPHAGKSPPPYAMGSNGFFVVAPDSSRRADTGEVVEGGWFVDVDDMYFRGGDVLYYFWLAQDAQGGVTSDPEGLTGIPMSVEDAEMLTGGLLEVSFLPTINWDPSYRARIEADSHGRLEPTQDELANSSQANCILYYQLVNSRRLSGDLNRTSFMYTLDQIGYRNAYDVYDIQGFGNTNNHLGGRATLTQATGYALIIQDSGRETSPQLPDGTDLDGQKIDQAAWYRDWLETASASEAGSATLWLIGSRIVEEKPENPLLTNTMGVVLVADQQDKGDNPDVEGVVSFTFANGSTADYAGDLFSVDGGCPTLEPFNALDASGAAVITHRWKSGGELGDGAVVMNANVPQSWNTIMMAVPWFDIHDPGGKDHAPPSAPPSTPSPERQLLSKVLGAVLSQGCQSDNPPSNVDDPSEELSNLPKRTALYQNVPNPFNPTTTIRFDLAREGRVSLRVYDVAGRVVRTLLDQKMPPGRYPTTWNGLDNAGHRASSGVYFYQLITNDFEATRKLVVMK